MAFVQDNKKKENQVYLRSIAREIFSKNFFSSVSLPLFAML